MSQPSQDDLRAEFIECLPYKGFKKLLAIPERPDREKAFSDAEHEENLTAMGVGRSQAELYMILLYRGLISHYVAASAVEQQKLREGMLRQLNAGAEQGTITIGFKSGNSTYSMDQTIVYDPPSNLFSGSASCDVFRREDNRTGYTFTLPTNFGSGGYFDCGYASDTVEKILRDDFLSIYRNMYTAAIDAVVRPIPASSAAAATPRTGLTLGG